MEATTDRPHIRASSATRRQAARIARHQRLRKKVVGWPTRPRLSVFRSHNHLYAQAIDDMAGRTLFGCSTKDERLKLKWGGNVSAATALGGLIASEAKQHGIDRVVFDRGGYLYHGRIKALAEAIRAGGVQV